MPHNTTICGVEFVGPILLVGKKGDEFCDCPVPLEAANKYLVEERK